jgi:hypothetical protein
VRSEGHGDGGQEAQKGLLHGVILDSSVDLKTQHRVVSAAHLRDGVADGRIAADGLTTV